MSIYRYILCGIGWHKWIKETLFPQHDWGKITIDICGYCGTYRNWR